MEKPLPVVLGILIKDNKILLINRLRGELYQKEKNYYNCVIEKSGDNHILRKFK